jgi:hypothetical protein
MKAATKTLWILIGAGILIGIALASIGYGLGGRGVYIDSRGELQTNNASSEPIQYTDLNTEAFSGLRVETANADVTIVPTTDGSYGYDIQGSTSMPEPELRGGTLIIEQQRKIFFGISAPLADRAKVTVFVPYESALMNATIETASGDIIIANLPQSNTADGSSLESTPTPFMGDDLDLTTVSGAIKFERDVDISGEINLDVVSGRMTVQNVVADSIDASMVSGDFDAITLTARDISIEGVSNRINIGTIMNVPNQEVDIQGVSYTAKLAFEAPASDFNVEVSKVSGAVIVDGQSMAASQTMRGNTESKLTISTVSGDVTVDFGLTRQTR